MSTFDFDPTDEGTPLNASTLNTAFTELGGAAQGVNALDTSSVERGALNSQHLPSLALADIFTNGYTAISPGGAAASGAMDFYDNQLPLTGGPAYPYLYQTFYPGAAVGPSRPYGPSAVAGDLGWAIVAYLGVVADAAEVVVGTPASFTTWGIQGLLVRGSLDLTEYTSAGGGHGVSSVAVGIGITDGAGTRYVIPRSVRFQSCLASRRGDVSTGAFITQADLDAVGDGTFSSAYLVVASAHPDSLFVVGGNNLEIGYYNLTVLPLYAGSL